jgi:hypothetical protein
VAPRLETLLRLGGTASAPLHHIQFRGLTFEHSTWLLPSNDGYVSDQASIVLSDELPGDDQITSYPGIRLPGRSTWRRLTPRCSIGTCCGISGRRRSTTT